MDNTIAAALGLIGVIGLFGVFINIVEREWWKAHYHVIYHPDGGVQYYENAVYHRNQQD